MSVKIRLGPTLRASDVIVLSMKKVGLGTVHQEVGIVTLSSEDFLRLLTFSFSLFPSFLLPPHFPPLPPSTFDVCIFFLNPILKLNNI